MAPTRYDVSAHEGVGPVRFGMTRDECRAAMPEPPESFRKGPDEPFEVDSFHDVAFQVHYNEAERERPG